MNLNWRGIFSIRETYNPGDVVYNLADGYTYICVQASANYPPQYPKSGFERLAGFNITSLDGGYF